ncbi:MAG: dockerin type I repeat-containing protein [Ruminococcus sp.]|nr:dockerin type I repeat-containing protein [Ruminococcus sp.]
MNIKKVIAILSALLTMKTIPSLSVVGTKIQENKYELNLSSSIKKVSTDDKNPIAYFYVDSNFEGEYITLMNADKNEPISKMLDDGKYSISGDDLPHDGVYSCKIEINNSEQKIYNYYAMIENEDGTISVSDTIQIKVFSILTQKDFNDMNAVNTKISDLRKSDTYSNMTFEEKRIAIEKLLYQLAETGTDEYPYSLIQKDTILFNNINLYSFKYSCGVIGTANIEDFIEPVVTTKTTEITSAEETTTTITDITATTTTDKFVLYGDVNDDRLINVFDLSILKYYLISDNKTYTKSADINNDGKITLTDAIMLQNIILNK